MTSPFLTRGPWETRIEYELLRPPLPAHAPSLGDTYRLAPGVYLALFPGRYELESMIDKIIEVFCNFLGIGLFMGLYLLMAWSLTHWPMSWDRALIVTTFFLSVQIRWHQL